MSNYYKKFKAVIKAQTSSGMSLTMEAPSASALLDEAISMAFSENGEEYVRAMFEKTMERQIQFKKNWDEQQAKKGAQNG